MNKSLILLFLIIHSSSIGQQIAYPFGYQEQNTMLKEVFFLNEEIVFVQYDHYTSTMTFDHISIETLELINSDSLNLEALFPENIEGITVPLIEEMDFGYEAYGFASSFISGEFQLAFRIQMNEEFDVIQFDNTATDLENTTNTIGNWGQKVYINEDGIYYFHSSNEPLSYTFRMNSDWEFLNSAEHLFYPHFLGTGFGRTFHGFDDELIICDRDSCLIIDLSLEIQDVSYFNFQYDDWNPNDSTYRSLFSSSSICLNDSSFLIQAIAYDDEDIEWPIPDYTYENLIWKISSSGEIIDSTFIRKLDTDEYHEQNILCQDESRIYGASIMRNDDTEVFLPAGDSLFFFAIDESLDSLWSSSFGSDLYYYKLHGLEADNHCLIAYGIEIPINGEPWELSGRFFILKYTWEELGLTMDELSVGSEKLMIYPNPASNSIYVETNTDLGSIENISIYDLMGNLVYLKKLDNMDKLHQEIDVSSWAKGMYVLKVFGKETSCSSKFIKE